MFSNRFAFAARALLAAGAILTAALPASAAVTFRLPGHIPALAISQATKTGRVDASAKMPVAFSLPLRNVGALSALIQRQTNPKDALYGHWLKPAEFNARFGPTAADYNAVIAYARWAGLTITRTSASRRILGAEGTAKQVEAAFSLHLNSYKGKDGALFYAPDANPAVPSALAPKISGVLGLSNSARLKPQFRILPSSLKSASGASPMFGGGRGHLGGLTPKDLTEGYDLTGVPVNGSGQTLGMYEEGGFYPSDIATYRSYYHLPNIPVEVRTVDGYGGGVDDPGISEEAALDIDMQTALAPGAAKILVYELPLNYPFGLVDALLKMADDDEATSISISYGLAEQFLTAATINAEGFSLFQMAAQGQTVYASSGDQGAYTDYITPYAVSDPASHGYITSVGGTALYLLKGQYLGETTWNEFGLDGDAGGGGVSLVHPIPFYQTSTDTTTNGGSSTMRNVPDIAADGAVLTGVDIYSAAAGGWNTFGGTSVSAPIWAGYTALVNQSRAGAGLPTIGFINPALYAIGNSFLSFFDYHDVIDGTNGSIPYFGNPGYYAGFGYDNVTGWGSFDGAQLLGDLTAAATGHGGPPGAPHKFTGTGGDMSATLTWKAADRAKGYIIFRFPGNNSAGYLATTTGLSYTDTSNLVNGTQYTYYLAAVNKNGQTFASYSISVVPTAP